MSAPRAASASKARRPDDSPFDFNLDAAQPPRELKPFVFQWKDRRWTMQHLEELDVWGLVEAAEGGDVAAMTGAFRLALGPKDWEEFHASRFPQWRFKALFRAYRQHCGINIDGTPVDGREDI
ncbi:hypothetical protein [Streptomyces sp. DH37]|uniref:hypothetical protein n=1 Tax=Streptomyces sp. DH37 TaxID=3040122 RepID=UPI002442DAD8|nr:hypothetical protein [Streptomyces sp. DH37]MDG9703819.1 hypothetical protein [Streptomyces sp. DH37]